MWAIGPLNERNEVSYHSAHSYGDRYIDFARSPTWNCPRPDESLLNQSKWQRLVAAATSNTPSKMTPNRPIQTSQQSSNNNENKVNADLSSSTSITSHKSQPSKQNDASKSQVNERWEIPTIRCPKDHTLWAQIGPVGGSKGYRAITGRQGWGIAWYINGLLIPEIYLKRGETYTFFVEGGNDGNNSARRHPLYLTDSAEGGYEFKSADDRKRERVFGGVGITANGTIMPTAEGRLCEWQITPATNIDDIDGTYKRFQDFQSTLALNCDASGRPSAMQFTPDKSTPSLLYYQCYTHRYLGWKIHIVDECNEDSPELQAADSIVNNVNSSIPTQNTRIPNKDKRLKNKNFMNNKNKVLRPNQVSKSNYLPKSPVPRIPHRHPPILIDDDDDEDISPYGPLFNPHSRLNLMNVLPQLSFLDYSQRILAKPLPVQSNVYNPPYSDTVRSNVYTHSRYDVPLPHSSRRHSVNHQHKMPKPLVNRRNTIKKEVQPNTKPDSNMAESGSKPTHAATAKSQPFMQSGFMPVQINSTSNNKNSFKNQNVWQRQSYVQRNKKPTFHLKKPSRSTTSPQVVFPNDILKLSPPKFDSTRVSDPPQVVTPTTSVTLTEKPRTSKFVFPTTASSSTTTTTTTPATPIPVATESSRRMNNHKLPDQDEQESQRQSVYLSNSVMVSCPFCPHNGSNNFFPQDSNNDTSSKVLTIHSVMRNSERMAEQSNNTDHTILSDVLRMIAQNVPIHTNDQEARPLSRPSFSSSLRFQSRRAQHYPSVHIVPPLRVHPPTR